MDTALRPSITLTDFQKLVPMEELHYIVGAVEKAIEITLEKEGTDPYIPHFRAIYSSCLFPRIWGTLEKLFRNNDEWELKKMPMTFVLIKRNVCQFHFYKGRANSPFKANSKRQRAIVQGELYGDLENLPSVILQHFSDRANSQLVGFHALFYVRGKLAEEFDILRHTSTHHPKLILGDAPQPSAEGETGLTIKFRPKKRPQTATVKKQQQKKG